MNSFQNCVPVLTISISADPMKEHCYAATISDTTEESKLKNDVGKAQNLNDSQKCDFAVSVTENAAKFRRNKDIKKIHLSWNSKPEKKAKVLSDDDEDILTIIETASSDVEKYDLTDNSPLTSNIGTKVTSNDVKFPSKTIKTEPVGNSATSSSKLKTTAGIEDKHDILKKQIRERDIKFIVSSNKRSLLKPLPVSKYTKNVTTYEKKEKKSDIKLIELPKPDTDVKELEKNGAAIEIMIKPEPLDLEEEFIVTETENIDADVSIEDFIANNSEIEMIGLEPEVVLLESKPRQKNRLYRCANCDYENTHWKYVRHKKVCQRMRKMKQERRIPANFLLYCNSFYCSACGSDHSTLRTYHSHSCSRNRTCPHCDMQFTKKDFTRLMLHLQSLIRQQFVAVYSLDNTSKAEFRKFFGCIECKAYVEKDQVFNHWEKHRYAESIIGTVTVKLEPSEIDIEVPEDALPPEMVETMIETLQSREKKKEKVCIMCVKYFGRDHDLKRHLIEHLIKDAYVKRQTYSALRCQICSADHKTLNYYKRHMRDHGRLPLYQCHICDKTFSDSSNFAKHKKVHNVRVKICDHCSKKFHSKTMLIKHIEVSLRHVPNFVHL